ncbi:hypothetical protein PMAC_002505 [Pneumocystis sp. 'macacae']|nr:hypothetical protein PMAC_002505 [Pneumocystis sp. 'macacae']
MVYIFSRTLYSILLRNSEKNKFKSLHTNTLKDISELTSHDEDFSSPIWRKSIFLGFCVFIVYKMDQWYASLHKGKGLFTRFFEHFMMSKEESSRLQIDKLKASSEAIKEYMDCRSIKRQPIYKLRFPEALDPENAYNMKLKSKSDVS